MKEYGKAIDDLSKAIELDPNNALTYTMRGAVYVIKMEYQKGVDDFTKAISLRPEETQVYITRALANRELKEYRRAVDDLTKATELDPNCATALYERGQTYQIERKSAKAINDFGKVIELDPKHDPAYNGLALLLATCADAKLRNGKKAIEYANKACALNGKNAYYLGTLAAALAEVGSFEEAVNCEQKALDFAAGYSDEDRAKARKRWELYQGASPTMTTEVFG